MLATQNRVFEVMFGLPYTGFKQFLSSFNSNGAIANSFHSVKPVDVCVAIWETPSEVAESVM